MKRTRLWMLLAVLALALGVFAAAGCGDDEDEGDGGQAAGEVEKFPANTTMGKIQERGEIRIGVKFDVPPFGFKNPQTTEVEGFDVDLGRFIAEALGVEPRLVEANPDNRIP